MSSRPSRSSRITAAANAVSAASALTGGLLPSSTGPRDLSIVRQKQTYLTAQLISNETSSILSTSLAHSLNFDDDILFPPGDLFFSTSAGGVGTEELKQLDELTSYISSNKGLLPSISASTSTSTSRPFQSSTEREKVRR